MPVIHDERIYAEALDLLKSLYGEAASFREGQYEAIEATLLHRRTLIVQKTGWGKSLVYFICTRIKRNRGEGMSLIISPLLALMDNQKEMAEQMGMHCAVLNSSVKGEDRKAALAAIQKGEPDIVFITPETLMKEETQRMLPQMAVGMFVIDEVHCISDWGHDFRLEYGKLGNVIQRAFSNVTVLGTTATANDRVIEDLKRQMGDDVYVSRGPLTRDSLRIQVLKLESRIERYAWLLSNLPRLPGTGIVYCLDRQDCDQLAAFLAENGIAAMPYRAGEGGEELEARNAAALQAFRENEIKVIVATVKLGMGYDKGDVSFVIHFQAPSSIVAWYQQAGRAGRNLKEAYVFLMSGREDDEINQYFIETAFPRKKESEEVYDLISNRNGTTLRDIITNVNASDGRIKKALYFMESEGFIRRERIGTSDQYFATPLRYRFNEEHYQSVTETRWREQEQMHAFMETKECLSQFAVRCLNDDTACVCGKCRNCTGKDILPGMEIKEIDLHLATEYVYSRFIIITPRKRYPDGRKIPYQVQPGICISRYGHAGYGKMVSDGKYPPANGTAGFNDQLVNKAAQLLESVIQSQNIHFISYVPSLRNNLVQDFTERLARRLWIQCVELLEKAPAPPQKEMENSSFQYQNAASSFSVLDVAMPPSVILVDDIVDSGWTFTVCGCKIMEKGCGMVIPFALASSGKGSI